jgi:PhnB protein
MHPTPSIQPYLNFNGRCEEALEFYKKTIGIKVEFLMRFKDAPDKSMISPGSEEKVMHCTFSLGSTNVMASDGRCDSAAGFQGFNLSLNVADAAAAEKAYAALSQGGNVEMPLTKTFFSPAFGMLKDKFGMMWMVHVPAPMK